MASRANCEASIVSPLEPSSVGDTVLMSAACANEGRDNLSFTKVVELETQKFVHDARFTKGIVRYKDLKDHMKNMQKAKYAAQLPERRSRFLEEECSICLETLGPASDVTQTACKHMFHTFCLVETLGNGICTSCPLCRTEVEKLVPGGIDGQSLKLIAKLRINIDAAQWCHKSILDEIQAKAGSCQQQLESVWVRKYVPFTGQKRKRLRQQIQTLIDQLELLVRFSHINVKGFTKICQKIDKKLSNGLAANIMEKYVKKMSYYVDCAEDGNGIAHALGEELKRMLQEVGGKADDNDVSVGCSAFSLLMKGDRNRSQPNHLLNM
mmetsp:Transcript_12712/g.29303  ORF Transcript_12712/g.29303 Transcript_12712/m.29303 type:complete len:324 (-) Transcript_12712:995-1966(-)